MKFLGLKYDLSRILNKKTFLRNRLKFKYDWGYFDNNGSYEASTKGHSDNFALYGNLGWNIFEDSNISLFSRDDHKQTGANSTHKIDFVVLFAQSDMIISSTKNKKVFESSSVNLNYHTEQIIN